MKYLLAPLFFVFLLSHQTSEAQNIVERIRLEGNNSDVYALSIDFAPPANVSGYEGTVTLKFAFRNCYGPALDYLFSTESLELKAYWHDGQRYPASHFSTEEFELRGKGIDLKVSFAYQTEAIGSMTFTDGYLGGGISGGCFGNGVTSIKVTKIEKLYKNNPQSWFDGLQISSVDLAISENYDSWGGHLRNLNLENLVDNQSTNEENKEESKENKEFEEQALEEKRRKEEQENAKTKEDTYQRFLEEARTHEQKDEFILAISAYQSAYNLQPATWILNKITELEEQEKIARKQVWMDNKEEEQENREQAQTDMTMAQISAMTGLAAILLDGIGKDNPNSVYRDGNWHLRAQLGLNFLSMPVVAKNTVEFFHAGSIQFQRRLVDYQVSSAGIQAGVACWPVFQQHFGLGMNLQGSLGMWSNGTFSSTYEATGLIYLGSSSVRMEGVAGLGERSTSIFLQEYASITEADYTIDSGGNYNYTTFQAGLRIMFDAWDTRAALRILGLVETGAHAATGALVELDFNNRISIMGRCSWNSRRIMTSFDYTNDFSVKHSNSGYQLELSVVRNFDSHRN